MRKQLCLAVLASAALVGVAFAQPAASPQTFVTKAAMGGMFEVQSSEVALQKGKGKDVKDFARMMIHDHGTANAKLKAIAAQQHLSVPADLDAANQGNLDTLRETKGPFDPTYIEMQRSAHGDAVMLFKMYAKDGSNAALKTFAQQTLPTLEMHETKISAIAKKDKVD